MKLARLVCLFAVALILGGCAHPMLIAPDLAKIERPADAKPKVHANVGYVLNDGLRKEERTTPGGGGDKVTTAPYRDLEAGFYKMLGNVFDNVTLLKAGNDNATVAQRIDYVITPVVTPNSSSTSMLTWPPTSFTIDLSCDIADPSGKLLYRKQVVGQGNAEFDEFKTDLGLSGKRAMQDALLKMQKELLELPSAPAR